MDAFEQRWVFMIEITDNESLANLCGEMADQPYVTLDTEFIRERTYYPVLALVQVSCAVNNWLS